MIKKSKNKVVYYYKDSFIIDNGKSGIHVWSGRKCNPKERQEAMRNALVKIDLTNVSNNHLINNSTLFKGFLQAKGYEERIQNAIKVTCMNEGYEPIEFRALFSRWTESKYSVNSNNKSLQVKFEACVLDANHQLASELQMIDDGSGNKKIWLIDNSDIFLLDESKHGHFLNHCCYIIEYKYHVNGTDKYIIFYWIVSDYEFKRINLVIYFFVVVVIKGRQSSAESQNVAVSKAIEMEKKLTKCHIVRVLEAKETKQFMSIFGGRIIILQVKTLILKNL